MSCCVRGISSLLSMDRIAEGGDIHSLRTNPAREIYRSRLPREHPEPMTSFLSPSYKPPTPRSTGASNQRLGTPDARFMLLCRAILESMINTPKVPPPHPPFSIPLTWADRLCPSRSQDGLRERVRRIRHLPPLPRQAARRRRLWQS